MGLLLSAYTQTAGGGKRGGEEDRFAAALMRTLTAARVSSPYITTGQRNPLDSSSSRLRSTGNCHSTNGRGVIRKWGFGEKHISTLRYPSLCSLARHLRGREQAVGRPERSLGGSPPAFLVVAMMERRAQNQTVLCSRCRYRSTEPILHT